MTTPARFLFLGTGGSMGIPVIGCHCAVCKSESPCNQRLRPSGLLTVNGKKILIDCGPDFRIQALCHHIDTLDGIIITHAHQDHIAGIDELRIYALRSKAPLPCLLSQETADDLKQRYHYIFHEKLPENKVVPRMELHLLKNSEGVVSFLGLQFYYVTYEQAGMHVNGFRVGNFAYISDIRTYPESIFESLKGVEVLVLSALRHEPSDFHFNIEEAFAFARRTGATHTWLTHISHELDHEATNALLPPNIRMAYDGLEVHFDV